MLRSCPGVKDIYILVRNKRGQGGRTRLGAFLQSKVFDRLRHERPDALGKVRAVEGNLTESDLGLSGADLDTLIENVSIIFHSAATVKFDESLKDAYEVNVMGTRHVLDLCKKLRNFCALVHVSTAYCNCDRVQAHEIIYPNPELPAEISEPVQCTGGSTANSTSGGLLERHPNTYTFTKALAESLVQKERENLRVAIVRPSIVTAAWKEPFPGWIDNYNATTGVIVVGGLGLLHSVYCEGECLSDHIPVDVVANTLICAAWHISTNRIECVKVYHCTSGNLNPQTWTEVIAALTKSTAKYPFPNTMTFPFVRTTSSRLWHNLNLLFLHYLPACAGDLILLLMGRKSSFVRSYHKIRKSLLALEPFTTSEWKFETENLLELSRDLSPTDKMLFNIDVRGLQWNQYWDQCVLGMRKYLFKAEYSALPQARRRVKILFAVNWLLKLLLAVFSWRVLMSQTAQGLYWRLLKPVTWIERLLLLI